MVYSVRLCRRISAAAGLVHALAVCYIMHVYVCHYIKPASEIKEMRDGDSGSRRNGYARMIHLFTDKENCSGCGACTAVCTVSAIHMEPDDEGFRYPRIDETRCIACGQCMAVCPLAGKREKGLEKETVAYAFQHSRPEVLRRSASGGAFTALAEAFFAAYRKAHVYGAVFCKGEVFHRSVDDPGELHVFSDSKYLESDLRDCFRSIRRRLAAGEYILFSGTPCQIDGLKATLSGLPKEITDQQLLLVEIVCNGVGSPLVWQKNWDYLKEREPSPPVDYSFRDKRVPMGYGVSWRMEDGKERREFLLNNFYWRLYISGLIMRPSCHTCHYAGYRRCADITIGDFHSFEETADQPRFSAAKGISLVLGNTDKGREFCRCLHGAGTVLACPLQKAMQPRLECAAPAHPLRNLAMKDISVLPYEIFMKKYNLVAGKKNH